MGNNSHDIFDKIFKRIITLSSPTVINFINGIFEVDYPLDSELTYNWTESVDDKLKKTIADTIITINRTDSFHIEAQMYKDDNSIMLRMFDYGFNHSKKRPEDIYDDDGIRCGVRLIFPKQIVIYLDSSKHIPDSYIITLVVEGGKEFSYSVPTIKFQDEDMSEVIRKHMIILLPFKLLKIRERFKKEYDSYTKNGNSVKLQNVVQELRDIYERDIIKTIEESFKNVHTNKSTGFFYNTIKDTDSDIIFALVQSLGREYNLKKFKEDQFDYIIIDEFHHAVANSYKNVLNYFKPKFMLGLTATPERMDNRDVFALCDYNNVYEIRLKEAINKGFLVPFKYYGIYDDTIDYSTVNMRNGKYDEKDLEEKLMINKRAELIYNHYLKYNSTNAIGFCSSINHALYMAEYFNIHNIPSAAVHSGEQGEYTQERSEAIAKLKSNELKILFTVAQSQTIFLQQLGRGLRKSENKTHLKVLDFIGNYKKANFIPFLLSGTNYDRTALLKKSVFEFEYPEDCYIDFDFQLVDIFRIQAEQELKVKDKIILEFNSVKGDLGHRPSRVELFLGMDEGVMGAMKTRSKLNPFRDYLTFLSENMELTSKEDKLINTKAHEFLKTIENTSMTKSYKMPILKAFYNDGNIKMEITDDDVYQSMKEFYSYASNGVDMLKDNSSKDYKNWGKKKYVSLAKRNPIKFLNKSHGEFFIKKEGCALALSDDLKEFIHSESFIEHFKDIIEYKTLNYYKYRFEKNELL